MLTFVVFRLELLTIRLVLELIVLAEEIVAKTALKDSSSCNSEHHHGRVSVRLCPVYARRVT